MKGLSAYFNQSKVMKFRPCIDLKGGKVVQIVGGTLTSDGVLAESNFESDSRASDFAKCYRELELTGGHVISLGPGNHDAAIEALSAFPGGMHFGGGVTPENASEFLDAGASHVIVTSYVFRDGAVDYRRLDELVKAVGPDRLVIDLSCRFNDGAYWVVTDKWTRFTELKISASTLSGFSKHCDEFLVHGVDVEGRMNGIEEDLVALLGEHSPIPVTYAGGARRLEDLDLVNELGNGRVDLTIGSALDIFGGNVPFSEVASWNSDRG